MIKAVIFDMDGLLINTEPYWQKTEREIFSGLLEMEIDEEMQQATFGMRTDEQIHYWYHHRPWPNPDFKKIERIYNQKILKFFLEEAELMPGAEYILDFFRNTGLNMALASSSSMELIETFVDRFNLRSFFSLLNTAETEEYGKPHPAVYITTASILSVHPSRCLAFEDSLNGVIAARAATMKVVAVPDPAHKDLPGYGIANMKLSSLTQFGNEQLNLFLNNQR